MGYESKLVECFCVNRVKEGDKTNVLHCNHDGLLMFCWLESVL